MLIFDRTLDDRIVSVGNDDEVDHDASSQEQHCKHPAIKCAFNHKKESNRKYALKKWQMKTRACLI